MNDGVGSVTKQWYTSASHRADRMLGETFGAKLLRLNSQARALNPIDEPEATGVVVSKLGTDDAAYTKGYYVSSHESHFGFRGGTLTPWEGGLYVFPVNDVTPRTDGNLSAFLTDTPSKSAQGWEVEFWTDAPAFRIRALGFAALKFHVLVDGRYVSKAGITYLDGFNFITLSFSGVRKPRRIQFRSIAQTMFGGVMVDALSTVWAPDHRDVIRACFSGDSFTDYMALPGHSMLPDALWCHVAANLLGWKDVRQVAVGGTGYTCDGGDLRQPIIQQIPRWIGINPDVVVFAAGFNDPVEELTANAQAALALTRGCLPEAPIFVLGPWSGSGGQNATTLAKEAAIKRAVAAMNDRRIIFIDQQTDPSPWITGTGYVGAANGTGNSDIYTHSDGVHPTESGHLHLGYRAANAIASCLSLI